MSTTVDQRVVSLKFDNSQFEQNVQVSLTTLDKLRESLNFGDETKKTFDNIEKNSQNVKMGGLTSAIEEVKMKFSSLDIIAATVIGNITNKVINKAGSIIKNTVGQVISGGIRRASNLEQAYFKLNGIFKEVGTTGKKTAAVMKDVDASVSGTAYGLDEAAVVASQFAASGIEASEAGGMMYDALRGVAGVAAMSGDSFSSIGNIFGTVAGQGRLMGDQLLQLSSRGLNAAATLADYYKMLGNTAMDTEEEVREMVSKGKVSFEDFAAAMNWAFGDQATKANLTFSGALSNVKASLSRIGADFFTPAMQSARRVLLELRTAFDVVRQLLSPVIGGLAKFTDLLSRRVTRAIRSFNETFAELTYNFADQGGKLKHSFQIFLGTAIATDDKGKKLTKTASNLQRTLSGLVAIVDSLRIVLEMAFNIAMIPIRPFLTLLGHTGNGILSVTASVGDLCVAMRNGLQKVSVDLNRKLLTLNTTIIKVFKSIKDWFLKVTKLDGVFKNISKTLNTSNGLLGAFKDLFSKSVKEIKKGQNGISEYNKVLGTAKNLLDLFVKPFKSFVFSLSAGVSPLHAFTNLLQNLKHNFSFVNLLQQAEGILSSLGEIIIEIVDKVFSLFGGGINAEEEIDKFNNTTKNLTDNITESTSALDSFRKAVEQVYRALQNAVSGNLGVGEVLAVLLGIGLIYGLRKLSKTVLSLEPISHVLNALTGSISQLGKAIKDFRFVMVTKQITTFTLALTALVVAMTQLAKLPADQVWAAGTSVAMIAAAIGGVAIALTVLSGKKGDKISKAASNGGPLLNVAKLLTALAISIGLLAAAIGLFSRYEDKTFQAGLERLILTMIVLTGSMLILSKLKTRIIASSKMLYAIAGSMIILASALKLLSTIKVSKDLLATTALLIILMRAMTNLIRRISVISAVSGKNLNAKSLSGLLLVSSAIAILAIALKIISKIDFNDKLAKNMAAFGLIFAAMAGLMVVVGKFGGANAHKAGVALLAMSVSLGLMCLVMKIAGTLTAKEIVMGIYVANSLMTFFAAVVVATKFAGRHAAKAGAALIAFGGAMVLITACMAVLSHISVTGIAKGILAIDAVGIMMVALIKSTEKAKITSSVKGTVLMFGVVIAVMTASLGVLSMIKTSKLLTSVFALTAVMAAFDSMMFMISKMDIKEKTIATLGIMAGCVAAIGIVIFLLGQLKPEKAVSAAIALASVMISTAAALMIIDKIKWTPTQSLKNMVVLAAIMAACGAFIFAISKMNVKPAHAAAIAALGAILIPLSVSLGILSVIGPVATEALPAIAIIAAAILAIGAIFTALGYVFQGDKGEQLSKAMDTGIEIMGKLGKMIGAFIGGIAGGVIDYASKGLIQLGTNLSAFMDNASGFISGMKNVPDGLGANAKNLATAILALSGAKFVDSFSNFMSWLQWPFGNPDKQFATNIGYLADGIKEFANKVSGIEGKTESINAAATAAKAISKFFDSIPKSGGFVQWLEGTTDIDAFVGSKGGKLKKVAQAILECSSAFDNGANVNVSAIKKASEAATAVAEFAQKIPKSGGWLQKIAGMPDLGQFSGKMGEFGVAIVNFSSSVSGIKDISGIKSATQACSNLASASETISKVGALNWGNTSAFKKHAPDFGGAIKNFADNTKGVDPGAVKKTATATDSLVSAMKKAAKIATGDGLSGFKNMASNLSDAVSSAAENASKGTEKVTKNIKIKGNVDSSGLVKALNSAISGLDSKVRGAKSAGANIARQMKSGFSSVKGWKKEGENAGQGFVNGLASKAPAAYKAGYKVGSSGIKGQHDGAKNGSPSKEGFRQGGFLGEGFRLGLLSMVRKVYSAGSEVGTMGLSAISKSSNMINDVMDETLNPTITPILDLSEIQNGVGTIDNMFSRTQALSAGNSFNARITPEQSLMNDLTKEFSKLIDKFDNVPSNNTVINGITYDDGSNIVNAVETLVHAVKVEGRV